MWSHEVSAQCGQFTQQALMQRSYAQQISPYDNRAQAENITGNLVNRGVGFAAPLAKFGGGLLGMDSPFSGALTWGGIGAMFGGPAGAGIGAGAGALIGTTGAIVGFGANNFMTGMQQQQQLNQSMRQNYGFMRPGGWGFTGSDMGIIGSQMRGMSHQVGPGGEMHSFGELTQLAASMGRMGFAQNVTDVRQFTQKFRQMVDTLKTVSKELGTSMQEAQDMVVGMRQSGVFNKADQVRMAQQIRANSLAGVSMEASNAMMNYGSQVARSIGGLGGSGAGAGMRTIQQIGAAMRVGALSESDIYNATGLTGEAGTQAFAQNQLNQSARFLQSSRGRWLTASMAGRNGQLDERSVEAFESGGFDVSRTRQLAQQNLNKVGRASFIRNEGRLKSELLNRFGGNLNVLALSGWAGGRGIDISAMGDREMLFAQRQLGMGRDDVEDAVKQANAMGDIGTYMKRQSMQDEYLKEISVLRKHQGLEGIKNRFNQLYEHAQSSVQEVGQNTLNSLTKSIERQLNHIFGTYESSLDTELGDAYTKFSASGGADAAARKAIMANHSMAQMGRAFGVGGGGGMSVDQYQRLAQGRGISDLVGKDIAGLLGGQTLEKQLGMPEFTGKTQEEFEKYRQDVLSFSKGSSSLISSDADKEWVAKNMGAYSTMGASDRLGKLTGASLTLEMIKMAAERGDKAAVGYLESRAAHKESHEETEDWTRKMHSISMVNSEGSFGGGFKNGVDTLFNDAGAGTRYGEMPSDAEAAQLSIWDRITSDERAPKIAAYLTGQGGQGGWAEALKVNGRNEKGVRGSDLLRVGGTALDYLGDLANYVHPLVGGAVSAASAALGFVADSGEEARKDAVGKIIQSKEGQEQVLGALRGDKGVMDKTAREYAELSRDQHPDEARMQFLKSVGVAGDIGLEEMTDLNKQLVANAAAGNKDAALKLSAGTSKKLQTNYAVDEAGAEKLARNALAQSRQAIHSAGEQENAALRREGTMAQNAERAMTSVGTYTESGELDAGAVKELDKAGLHSVVVAASNKGRGVHATAALAEGEITPEKYAAYRGQESEESAWSGMSASVLRDEIQKTLSFKGKNPAASAINASESNQMIKKLRGMQSAARTVGQYGEGGAAAKWMGLDLGADTMRLLSSKRGDTNAQISILTDEHVFDHMSEKQQIEFKHGLALAGGDTGSKYMSGEEKLMPIDQMRVKGRQTIQGVQREVKEKAEKESKAKEDAKEKASVEQTKALNDLVITLKALVTVDKNKSGTQKVTVTNIKDLVT